MFKNAGYKTSSMHDYTEQYYVRSVIHKNLGSDAYYNVNDLNIPYYNEYSLFVLKVSSLIEGLQVMKIS